MVGGMNQTPAGERVHIAFFGRRNVGKSSLMNAFTGQDLSVVSPVEGTTTDAVYKAMELLPLGPVVLIDTPGLDDTGELGEKRVQKAEQVMRKADIAVVVAEAGAPLNETERKLIDEFERREIPWLLVYNKEDLAEKLASDGKEDSSEKTPMGGEADITEKLPAEDKTDLPEKGIDDKRILRVSAKTGFHIRELKERVAALLPGEAAEKPLVGDLLSPGDTVVLVVPIDAGAPKGRLILPQQQVIRGVLEAGASALVCRDSELEGMLQKLVSPPGLVITDSQVFDRVNRIVPDSVPLTSFSILMARYKGDLALLAEGAAAVERLRDGDRVLICEGCTHHRQCEDIGTVKIPNLIRRYLNRRSEAGCGRAGGDMEAQCLQWGCEQGVCGPAFTFTSGTEFPTDVSSYKLVVHCGGCMLNRREMQYRLERCREQGVPVTNYGVLIAYLNGILERAVRIF